MFPNILIRSIKNFSVSSILKLIFILFEIIFSFTLALIDSYCSLIVITSIFSTIGDFRGYLGNAYLQFGEPIDLKSFLNKHSPNWQDDVVDLNKDTEKKSWLYEVTPLLGNRIMTNINNATVVTSSSLFASAI